MTLSNHARDVVRQMADALAGVQIVANTGELEAFSGEPWLDRVKLGLDAGRLLLSEPNSDAGLTLSNHPERELIQYGDEEDVLLDAIFNIAKHGDRGNPAKMRAEIRAVLSIPAAPQAAVPVGTLTVSHFKGHLENHDFDYVGSLPDGSYKLFATPLAAVQSEPAAEQERPHWSTPEGQALALKEWYVESDGITVCIPSELLNAVYRTLTTPPVAVSADARDAARYRIIRAALHKSAADPQRAAVRKLLEYHATSAYAAEYELDASLDAMAGKPV